MRLFVLSEVALASKSFVALIVGTFDLLNLD